MLMNDLNAIAKVIKQVRNVVICGHAMPDGDSIGSTVAMGLLIKMLDKNVTVISPDPVPRAYGFLPGVKDVMGLKEFPEACDLAVILDCTDLNRTGDELAHRLQKVPTIINIDHHVSNHRFGHYNFVEPAAAAAGELVYALAGELGLDLTPDVAMNLYTAVAMDTGSFRYDNTTAETHKIAARLIGTGINVARINENLFENKELITLRLLGRALSGMQVSPCGRVAWISVPYSLMEEMGARDEHADGIVNYPKTAEGVEIGLLFREIEPGRIKVGFRSKETADVNKLAAIFGGGGHPRAAGCMINGDLAEVEAEVIAAALAILSGQ
ncbi:MAG: DHH family phosphoesterase [Bacillota bacterium]